MLSGAEAGPEAHRVKLHPNKKSKKTESLPKGQRGDGDGRSSHTLTPTETNPLPALLEDGLLFKDITPLPRDLLGVVYDAVTSLMLSKK